MTRSPKQLRALVHPPKAVKPRNPAHQAKAFAHDYHSKERRAWVASQPCVACVIFGDVPQCRIRDNRGELVCDNAHVCGSRGAKLKGHYSEIAPLGRWHHSMYDSRLGKYANEDVRAVIQLRAAQTQEFWLLHQGASE